MKIFCKAPFLLLMVVAVLASCKKSNTPPLSKSLGKDLVLTSYEQQKVTADNSFTLKLFKNLYNANNGDANLFLSPLSASFALGMASNGSNGPTLTAFQNTLGFNGLSQQQVNAYYNNLITNLPQLDPNTTLNIANSIWYRQGFTVLPQFLQTDSNYFHAKIAALDFTSASAVSTINNWVSTQTNGKITNIVNQISPTDVMLLVNAIYFKSTWKEKFDASKTAPLPFYLADNSQVQASFMDGTIDFNRYYDNEVNLVELPYSNSKFSMVIAMPVTGTSLPQLVAGLDSAKWQKWVNGLHAVNSELKLPKFTFSYNTNLNNALTALGLGIAFSQNADFSGINTSVPLQITAVNQKAFVAVDETGTTAAAATTVVIGISAVLNTPPTVIDHPFIFMIREMSSGVILFAGVVNNPLLTGN